MVARLTMACTSDFSGLLRGKGFASGDLDARLQKGIGWTPTNVQITCFDTIATSPYGALGDLVLWPAPETLATVDLPDGAELSFVLGDIRDLEGAPWECCTRSLLKSAIERFHAVSGLELRATFEHEFMVPGLSHSPAFTLQGFAEGLAFLEALHAALESAGLTPDSLLREYGPDQYEVTLPPQEALRAADEAAMLREITRAVARALGLRASFSPLLAPDIVGNGVHIHFSFWDAEGQPVTHDPDGQDELAAPASAFAAGVLAHLNAVSALTAPSVISPHRLVPHRWSAAFNNLGRQDREAAIRICPVTARDADVRARQFNLEFRAADACASPHLALAALVIAGTLGLQEGLTCAPATTEDLSLLNPRALNERGLRRLPVSLAEAIGALEAERDVLARLPGAMPAIYAAHKRGELAHVERLSEADRLAAYARVY